MSAVVVDGIGLALAAWITARAFAWCYYFIERLSSGD